MLNESEIYNAVRPPKPRRTSEDYLQGYDDAARLIQTQMVQLLKEKRITRLVLPEFERFYVPSVQQKATVVELHHELQGLRNQEDSGTQLSSTESSSVRPNLGSEEKSSSHVSPPVSERPQEVDSKGDSTGEDLDGSSVPNNQEPSRKNFILTEEPTSLDGMEEYEDGEVEEEEEEEEIVEEPVEPVPPKVNTAFAETKQLIRDMQAEGATMARPERRTIAEIIAAKRAAAEAATPKE